MELKINNITKQYGNNLAVDNLSITFKKGVNGLLGANGSGKTTLIKMICDTLIPNSGKVLLDGINITSLGEDYREQLGYLPQSFGYYPNFTSWDFMIYLSSLKGLPRRMAENRCKELLDMVGLYEVKKKKIKTYSGGMRQRLGIAQALINDPKILILDEPTVGLDPKERAKFRNIISEFSSEKLIVLSTHIVSDVEYIADKIMIMKDGHILQNASIKEICDPIENYVWIVEANPEDVDNYVNKYVISNLRHGKRSVELRIVSETAPSDRAISVAPNLEDLYLYYFKDD